MRISHRSRRWIWSICRIVWTMLKKGMRPASRLHASASRWYRRLEGSFPIPFVRNPSKEIRICDSKTVRSVPLLTPFSFPQTTESLRNFKPETGRNSKKKRQSLSRVFSVYKRRKSHPGACATRTAPWTAPTLIKIRKAHSSFLQNINVFVQVKTHQFANSPFVNIVWQMSIEWGYRQTPLAFCFVSVFALFRSHQIINFFEARTNISFPTIQVANEWFLVGLVRRGNSYKMLGRGARSAKTLLSQHVTMVEIALFEKIIHSKEKIVLQYKQGRSAKK